MIKRDCFVPQVICSRHYSENQHTIAQLPVRVIHLNLARTKLILSMTNACTCCTCRDHFHIWTSSTCTLDYISCHQSLLGSYFSIPLSTDENRQEAQVHPLHNSACGSSAACNSCLPPSYRWLHYHRHTHHFLCW